MMELSQTTVNRLGCRFKADCPLVGRGPKGGVPSVGVFLRDPSRYLREFRRKPRKTPKGLGRQARPGIVCQLDLNLQPTKCATTPLTQGGSINPEHT